LLILDFGAQYTQLIARRIREAGVYCEIHPFDVPASFIREFAPVGVILSGGPESVTFADTPRIPAVVFELEVPVLGICYGMQAMAEQLGGVVRASSVHEFGHAVIQVHGPTDLLATVNGGDTGELPVWMSHGDKVVTLPPGFKTTASTSSAPIAAMECAQRRFYGVQFHPEVTHTEQGADILAHFALGICDCQGLWTPANIAGDAIAHARRIVGDEKVVLGLSGGVDSSVVAAILSRAIGDQLTCVFVDNGLLRKGEATEVEGVFQSSNALSLNLICVAAEDEFISRLAGESDPESKRKIIGASFIEIFDREARKIPGVAWLAQGTIYPDVIESAASKFGKAQLIKSHHNVGGLPEKMHLKLIEPLRELFKDEVRKIGMHLGLPHAMVYRHPFPGPGLGVRILGEVTTARADVLREADAIFLEELREADYYDRVSQAFAVLLPVKSVGVVGDARRYADVIALRAVETTDFMTARWAHLPYQLLERISNRIINEVPDVSRVVYDVSSKPPATIEWE
jgi:GMP synthase (glutamine-hydrolysing)